MGTDLANNYLDDCYDGLGGIDWAVALQKNKVLTFTTNANEDTVTAIAMKVGSRGYDFHFEPETAFFNDTITTNAANGSNYSPHELHFMVNNIETQTRNVILSLGQRRTTWIVRLADGTYRVIGGDLGLILTTGAIGSGTLRDDRQGGEIILMANEKLPAYVIAENLVLALLLPAS